MIVIYMVTYHHIYYFLDMVCYHIYYYLISVFLSFILFLYITGLSRPRTPAARAQTRRVHKAHTVHTRRLQQQSGKKAKNTHHTCNQGTSITKLSIREVELTTTMQYIKQYTKRILSSTSYKIYGWSLFPCHDLEPLPLWMALK